SSNRITRVLVFMAALSVAAANFKLEIVHTNDMHSRFHQTNNVSGICSKEDAAKNQCYGGFARVSEAVITAKSRNKDKTLFLIAGDIYQGSIWYTVYKWRIVSVLTNMLQPDAMSLGNHEFDDGVKGLVPFIKNATFPVLAANLDISKEPDLMIPNLKNSNIFTADGGIKIAVIGYVTPETKFLSQAEGVVFLDEIKSINAEIAKLKRDQSDINIFIALGHSGYEMDKKIAADVPDIDIVIGGHTNTFLYTGKQPDSEVPEGLYPTWITQSSGRRVPVVQSYAYTKYLGQLSVEFDSNGEVIKADGNPLLLDKSINQDPFILQELVKWEKNMSDLEKKPVGKTKVFLEGSDIICRLEECNMGNMIADAFVDYMVEILYEKGWTSAPIAFYNGGSVRSSIDSVKNSGDVTMGDVLGVLPFRNEMILIEMKGSHIMQMLEWSMSGLKVVYDLEKPNGKRVVEVLARCGDCRVPVYKPVVLQDTYNVLVTEFTANGGDGYAMITKLKRYQTDVSDSDMVVQYFQKRSPIYTGLDGRIQFVDHTKARSGTSAASPCLLLSLLIAVISVISVT
ncbi:hypothetical protein L9F63_001506, partial [Diploptera punctata]